VPVNFVPFQAFVPDGGDYGSPLSQANNVIPIHGSFRTLRKKSRVAKISSVGPVTGAFVHIFQQAKAVQFMRPTQASGGGPGSGWLTQDGSNSNTTLGRAIDEVVPDDSDYIIAVRAPSENDLIMLLSDPVAPGATSGHYVRYRYRIPVAGTWKLEVDLSEASAITVSSLPRAGATSIATTSSAHGLVTGQKTRISGATQTEYNGAVVITSTGANTFDYTVSGTPATPATGSIKSRELIDSTSQSGSAAVSDWTSVQDLLTGTEAGYIVDYSNVAFFFWATCSGSLQEARPASDVSVGSWTTQAGGSTDLYTRIDEAVVDDTDYVQSATLTPGGTAYTYEVGLQDLVDPGQDETDDWAPKFRVKGANNGLQVVAKLLQGTTEILSETFSSLATSFADKTMAVEITDLESITDFTDLRFSFEASYPAEVTETVFQNGSPISETDNQLTPPGYQVQGAATAWEAVNEAVASDAEYFYHPLGYTSFDMIFPLTSSLEDPLVSTGYSFKVRAKRFSVFGTGDVITAYLMQGTNVIATLQENNLTADWVTYTHTLTATEANQITNHALLKIRVRSYATGPAISWVQLRVPEPHRVQISFAELEAPSAARVEVSWAEVELPDPTTVYRGDINTMFAGTATALYEVDEVDFDDISIAGGYTSGATTATGWHFASWGNDVIATNKVDPVQVRVANAGDFANLITSADTPQARFVAAVRNHLMLGDINYTGHFSDEVWWSKVEDASTFDDPFVPANQSDFQRILSQPGQIMGLVGGDFGLVFKRRSIHRMPWVGGRAVFAVEDLSRGIGTPYPRSIVNYLGQTYFWGGNSFYVTDGYSPPQKIGSQVLSRFLTDSLYSADSIIQESPASLAIEDQVMVGSYDPAAGVILWSYQRKGTDAYQHDRVLVYNPAEDRWALFNSEDDLAFNIEIPNTIDSNSWLLKGTACFEWDGADTFWFRYADDHTAAATLKTKKQTMALDGQEKPVQARIRGVMPILTINGQTEPITKYPLVSLTVEAYSDPRFFTGGETVTYTQSSANEAGWFPVDVNGSWFRFQLDIPELAPQMMTAVAGLYVDWEPRGRP